ncbi:MAG TPA: right-handed parallel beta-helix repeat-containing protein [Polyangiaceae bacterium]|nr:right-handed parallel beta-helix repeat-containing protein [Polyangiaceae bacterium]
MGESVARSCEPEACACSTILPVADAAALGSALSSASPGDCIELTGASYSDVIIPNGVQVISRRKSPPRLGSVTMAAESGLCGVAVGDGLVVGPGASDVTIRKVRVSDAPTRGIFFDEGASGRVADTTVEAAGEVGLLMGLSSDVTLERVAVLRSTYFGVAATCGSCECDEAPPFTVKMRKVAAVENKVSGMWFEGIDVQAEAIAIRDSAVGQSFDFGSGLTVRCSRMIVRGLEAVDNADYGIGIFDADVTLEPGDIPFRVSGNLFGVWAIEVGATSSTLATLRGATIEDNAGAGVAIGGAFGPGIVELTEVTVRRTESIAIPVLVNGVSASAENVGDGILWLDGVETRLTDVEVADSERASLLINGASAGTLDGVRFTGSDAGDAPLMQNYFGGPEPTAAGETPDLVVTSEEIYPVPPTPQFE